ncbi:MAG: Holliday junction resolvase RuvX [Tissierellia bacterium]|nr:Holliday junction resolvase RuvX [Tissierellia bacterium]
MERIMGLDVGDKTIGVAISDPMLITAQGIKTIKRESNKKDIDEISSLVKEYNVTKIVVGLPKNMNNTIGPQGEKVIDFVNKLNKKVNVEIIFQDERLTTVAAERTLIEGNMSRKKRKNVIDMVAATYILQTYLDRR